MHFILVFVTSINNQLRKEINHLDKKKQVNFLKSCLRKQYDAKCLSVF